MVTVVLQPSERGKLKVNKNGPLELWLVLKQWEELMRNWARSFGCGWKVLSEEVTFTLGFLSPSAWGTWEGPEFHVGRGATWNNSAKVCWNLTIESGKVIHGVTEMSWFLVLKHDCSVKIVNGPEQKKRMISSVAIAIIWVRERHRIHNCDVYLKKRINRTCCWIVWGEVKDVVREKDITLRFLASESMGLIVIFTKEKLGKKKLTGKLRVLFVWVELEMFVRHPHRDIEETDIWEIL